jgi:hypothetical protein
MADLLPFARDDARFIHPKTEAPPKGVKLLLRTRYGVAVLGKWEDDGGFTGWFPLPKKEIAPDDTP